MTGGLDLTGGNPAYSLQHMYASTNEGNTRLVPWTLTSAIARIIIISRVGATNTLSSEPHGTRSSICFIAPPKYLLHYTVRSFSTGRSHSFWPKGPFFATYLIMYPLTYVECCPSVTSFIHDLISPDPFQFSSIRTTPVRYDNSLTFTKLPSFMAIDPPPFFAK